MVIMEKVKKIREIRGGERKDNMTKIIAASTAGGLSVSH